jgi:hypothetical protein
MTTTHDVTLILSEPQLTVISSTLRRVLKEAPTEWVIDRPEILTACEAIEGALNDHRTEAGS